MSSAPLRVGILALQGDVREHARVVAGLGAEAVAVRRPAELVSVDALILPGGESTVIDKLARAFGMQQPIRDAIASGLPIYGTCAGLILLADRIEGAAPSQQTFGGLDVLVRRNAFGSQAESFETELAVVGRAEPLRAAFIRAPLVVETGPGVQSLATLPGGAGVVAVQQGAIIGTAFHPEVTGETSFHERLLDLVRERGRARG